MAATLSMAHRYEGCTGRTSIISAFIDLLRKVLGDELEGFGKLHAKILMRHPYFELPISWLLLEQMPWLPMSLKKRRLRGARMPEAS